MEEAKGWGFDLGVARFGGARVLACREKGRGARKIILVLALVKLRRVRWIMSVVVKGG